MAFIVLLVLALGGLTQVEVSTQRSALLKEQARQNALFGALEALGQLQRLSGPDQRVMATAAVLDMSPETAEVTGVANPHWLGVWDVDPGLVLLNEDFDLQNDYYDYANRRSDRFLGWLVSGSSAAELVNLDHAVAQLGASRTAVLVGEDLPAGDATRVEVEKVTISSDRPDEGNYAYWIGSESTKAKVNLVDEARKPGSTDTAQLRSSFMVSQRNAIEAVDSQNNIFAEFPQYSDQLDLLIETEQLANLDALQAAVGNGGFEEELGTLFHDITIHGSGLLTDTLHGGFRTDLSALLRQPLAGAMQFSPGLVRYGQGGANAFVDYPQGTTAHPAPAAPTWEQMRSYFHLAQESDTAVSVRKHTDEIHGMYPIVTRFFLEISPVFERDPVSGDILYYDLSPVIVLWNPYNVPLQIAANSLWADIGIEKRNRSAKRGLLLGNDWVKLYEPGDTIVEAFAPGGPGSTNFPFGNVNAPNILENGDMFRLTDSVGTEYTGFSFRFPEVVLAPGQVRSFGIATDLEFYSGDNLLSADAVVLNPTRVRLPHKDDAGRLLRASMRWSLADNSLEQKTLNGSTREGDYREQGAIHFNIDVKSPSDLAARINPFYMSLGLRDGSSKSPAREDYLQLIERIEVANPNELLYHNRPTPPGEWPRSERSIIASTQNNTNNSILNNWGLSDPLAMRLHRIVFDVVAATGSTYADNDLATAGQSDVKGGYRIRNRWLTGQNFRAPWHGKTAADPAGNTNFTYGGLGVYGKYTAKGTHGSPNPQVQLDPVTLDPLFGPGVNIGNGVSKLSFFEIPRADTGILSLGALQHMLTSRSSASHAYGIGSGVADMRMGDSENYYLGSGFTGALTGEPLPVDQGFLQNHALWDGHFFSGLQTLPNAGEVESGKSLAPNSRYVYGDSATTYADLAEPERVARSIAVDGMFDINSTSVNAWKAILGGRNGLDFNPQTGSPTGNIRFPVSRFDYPQDGSTGTVISNWNGFRELSDGQLQALAEAIVEQVKRRGPFFSLSDFVNRRLVAGNTEEGLYGALEAAIRNSGINAGLASHPFDSDALPKMTSVGDNIIESVFAGDMQEGIAGWVKQGDILQAIAPFISARSDVFRIRSYGDVVNQGDSEVVASARCELIVQRLPEYVDSTANDALAKPYVFNAAAEAFEPAVLSTLNAKLGRKYRILSFRWID